MVVKPEMREWAGMGHVHGWGPQCVKTMMEAMR